MGLILMSFRWVPVAPDRGQPAHKP